jgi:hypothetical protein
VGECSWSAQEITDSTLLPPAETSVGSRVGYKKSLSLLAETIFRCDTGIPVWLIRPYSALASICIRALAPVAKPIGVLPLEALSRPVYPAIYRGRGDVLEKYIAMARNILEYLKYPNPFGYLCVKPLAAPLPVSMPTQHTI